MPICVTSFGIGGGLLREVPRLGHRPAHRLLHVDVFANRHRRRRDRRVHVIGRGNDHRVDVFLLRQHLAVVAIGLESRQLLVDESLDVHAVGFGSPLLVGPSL